MKHARLLLIPSLAVALAMTGCASKKPATTTGSTDTVTSGSGTAGANTTGTGTTSGLTGENLQTGANAAAEAMRTALASRVVNFDYDSSQLSQKDFATLNAHARYLAQTNGAKVTLAGHTDERGTREYNMALGERRALAVQTFLLTNGVPQSQIDTVSYGKEMPINEATNEAAWAENRRVEIKYDAMDPNP
ncbi:MAG: peptidoglycan-associated lipoprotein Pal [Pseudomonadota bacterium]|nr:peptidoglycan-associated lipoprotein Pal [Pseudomonadota bacterium]